MSGWRTAVSRALTTIRFAEAQFVSGARDGRVLRQGCVGRSANPALALATAPLRIVEGERQLKSSGQHRRIN